MEPIDLSRDALVFAHVPKTGGTSLKNQLVEAIGEAHTLFLRQSKVDNFRFSRAQETSIATFIAVRRALTSLRGDHYLVDRQQGRKDLSDIRLMVGHVRMGQEPALGRRPRYVAMAREPYHRFLSNFYFFRDRLANGGVRLDRHPAMLEDGRMPETPEAFFEAMTARSAQTWINGQTRYFAPSGRFEDAKAAIEAADALVAPIERMSDLTEMLSRLMPTPLGPARRDNISQSRPKVLPATAGFREQVRAVFDEDVKLYEYVRARFAKQFAAPRDYASAA